MSLRRTSPYAAPDYHPPTDAPEAFKRIVAFMQSNPHKNGAVCVIASLCDVSYGSMRRYLDFHAGKTALSKSLTDKIEQAAKNL